jgi:hypothetical protein
VYSRSRSHKPASSTHVEAARKAARATAMNSPATTQPGQPTLDSRHAACAGLDGSHFGAAL